MADPAVRPEPAAATVPTCNQQVAESTYPHSVPCMIHAHRHLCRLDAAATHQIPEGSRSSRDSKATKALQASPSLVVDRMTSRSRQAFPCTPTHLTSLYIHKHLNCRSAVAVSPVAVVRVAPDARWKSGRLKSQAAVPGGHHARFRTRQCASQAQTARTVVVAHGMHESRVCSEGPSTHSPQAGSDPKHSPKALTPSRPIMNSPGARMPASRGCWRSDRRPAASSSSPSLLKLTVRGSRCAQIRHRREVDAMAARVRAWSRNVPWPSSLWTASRKTCSCS